MKIFHSLVIPFLGGFALTLAKLIADHEILSFDKSNDIALDMVLLGIGALGAFYIEAGRVEPTTDAGIVDAFLAAILLYMRYWQERLRDPGTGKLPATGPVSGIAQLILGAAAIIWTRNALLKSYNLDRWAIRLNRDGGSYGVADSTHSIERH